MNVHEIHATRVQVDRLCWAGIGLGLAFTMTNVQHFAAAGAVAWSLPWCAAWLLDPMVSLVLIAVLRAEQVTARCGLAKWFTLAATYVMNTWAAYTTGTAAEVVLHSVPPLVVFVTAEAVTALRDTLSTASAATQAEPDQAKPDAAEPVGRVRRSSAEYLADARAAWSPGTVITPAWIRQATGCSRGLSSRLAAQLRDTVNGAGSGVGA